jgi:hypothetical protein
MENDITTMWEVFYALSDETQNKLAERAVLVQNFTGLNLADSLEVVMKTYRYVFKRGVVNENVQVDL